MTDLVTLREAFDELERRADAAATRRAGRPVRPAARPRGRAMLVAASVVAVLALATGLEVLAGRSDDSNTPAAGSPSASTSGPAARTSVSGSASASAPASTPPATRPSTPRPTTSKVSAPQGVPKTPAELARRFRTVLGNTATFTYGTAGVTGPFIVGTLMNRASGRSGGFDLQFMVGSPGDDAMCEDADKSKCTVRRLSDGSSLSVGREPLNSAGMLYLVNLVRPDGVGLLMHLSNERDPKGGSTVMGTKPPLTTTQMVALLRSDRW